LNERVDVAVIGAGVSGLAAALGAQQAGASVAVFEAESCAGGVIRTARTDGFVIEQGPNSFAASDATHSLLREIGLDRDIVAPLPTARRRYIVRDGKLHALPQSPATLLSSRLLSWPGKLRALAEPLVPRSRSEAEESLASIVRRRFGTEVLDYIVDPFVSGVYAGDPENLSSKHAMRILGELEQRHGSVLIGAMRAARVRRAQQQPAKQTRILSFRDGLAQLPLAMTRALHAPPMLGTRVVRMLQQEGGWSITAKTAEALRTVRARSLVVSLPAYALESIEWPQSVRAELQSLLRVRYAPVATIALGFPRDCIAHPLDGFGVLVPHREKRGVLGVLFNSSTFVNRAPAGQVLLTAFVGGARNAQLPLNDVLLRAVLIELQSLLGISGEPTLTCVTRWERGIPQFNVGHDAALSAAAKIEQSNTGLILTGSYLGGVSLGDCLANGLAAGRRAATVS
jgi:oxygen-dependent protoporphyrinogen oxidase